MYVVLIVFVGGLLRFSRKVWPMVARNGSAAEASGK